MPKISEGTTAPNLALIDTEGQSVAHRYGQEVKLLRFGRMPAMLVIDKAGQVRHKHNGGSTSDIPPNLEIGTILDGLNQEE